LTDGAVWPEPDLPRKIDLIFNLVSVSRALGLDRPRIAVVAAVEAIYPQMPVTLDAAVLAKMAERGQIRGALVDGPLSYDVAVDMEAAQAKGIRHSAVAGQADAMLASSIEVANGVYLAMSLYGRCDIGGVIAGGLVPVAASFPSDSLSSRFHSILLAILLS
jgi:phosphate butyryltransferase